MACHTAQPCVRSAATSRSSSNTNTTSSNSSNISVLAAQQQQRSCRSATAAQLQPSVGPSASRHHCRHVATSTIRFPLRRELRGGKHGCGRGDVGQWSGGGEVMHNGTTHHRLTTVCAKSQPLSPRQTFHALNSGTVIR